VVSRADGPAIEARGLSKTDGNDVRAVEELDVRVVRRDLEVP
jgi:hypothetical protein